MVTGVSKRAGPLGMHMHLILLAAFLYHPIRYGWDILRGVVSRPKLGLVGSGIGSRWPILTYPKSRVRSEWPIPTYTISEASREQSGYVLTYPDFWAKSRDKSGFHPDGVKIPENPDGPGTFKNPDLDFGSRSGSQSQLISPILAPNGSTTHYNLTPIH